MSRILAFRIWSLTCASCTAWQFLDKEKKLAKIIRKVYGMEKIYYDVILIKIQTPVETKF
jgi:hypothetical protein